jgi:hypothetical protein
MLNNQELTNLADPSIQESKMASADTSSAEIQSIVLKKYCSSVSESVNCLCLISSRFWAAGKRAIPNYNCSPWDFYKLFVRFKSGLYLVYCNNRTDIRVITLYIEIYNSNRFNILQIQYLNFIDIYKVYYFKDQVFLISEYIDFLLEDLLKCSVYPTESEIVYIISQVR